MAMMNARGRLRERLHVPMELDINFSNALQMPSPSTISESPATMRAAVKGFMVRALVANLTGTWLMIFQTAPETMTVEAHRESHSLADVTESHELEEATTRTAPGLNQV